MNETRLAELIKQTTAEILRLGWDLETSRNALEKVTGGKGKGKLSRMLCTESELENFLLYLQLHPTSEEVNNIHCEASEEDEPLKLYHYQLLGNLREHRYYISALAISPDGQILASSSCDGTVKIWNLHTGELLHDLTDHTDQVWSVAITPDGKTLVSSSRDTTIKLWNLQTGELKSTISGYPGWARSIAISPDGQLLACARDYGPEVQIWHLNSGELLYSLPKGGEATQIAFSTDGQLLAGCFNSNGKVWNVPTMELVNTFQFIGFQCAGALSPDVLLVAQGYYKSNLIELRNTITGKKIRNLYHIEEYDEGEATALGFSPDGRILVSGGCGIIQFWELSTGRHIGHIGLSYSGGHTAFAFSRDGQILVCGDWGGVIEVWWLSFNPNPHKPSEMPRATFQHKSSLPPDFNPELARWEELQKKFPFL